MIEYLKKNRYGRVTFLPLDAVKGKEFARKEILLEPGVIGADNQLVIYDEVYKDLFASLLGQILLSILLLNVQLQLYQELKLHINH